MSNINIIQFMIEEDAQNNRQTSVFDEDEHYLINENTNPSFKSQPETNFCNEYAIIFVIVSLTHLTFFDSSQGVDDDSTKTIQPAFQILKEDQNQTNTGTFREPISQQVYNKRIYGGQIHYSRIPVEYWQHRILMLKAMGLNTLSIYVFWNYHELERGKFDYQTQNKNITKFLELAVKRKMKVLLRPGPYICGEWDFGGLPARLLGIKDLVIRSNNEVYLEEVRKYFQSLAPIIKPFLTVNNGPIRLIQIQNELGSYSVDPQYTEALVKMWNDLGVVSQFYIEDASKQAFKNYFKGAAIGISGGTKDEDFQQVSKIEQVQNRTLVFGGQIYTGWMTHWGQKKWGSNPYHIFKRQVEYLFQHSKQFSLYMAHGGTNFGLTAGANAQMHDLSYEPMITSYDYDAAITQQGRRTLKSDLIVELMKNYVRPPSIPFPQPVNTIAFDQVYPKITASILSSLGQADLKQQSQLYYFEHPKIGMYNQGIVVYQTYLGEQNYHISLIIHDFALVFVDNHLIYTLVRSTKELFGLEVQCGNEQCRLLILVQAMGHNNYGKYQSQDIKGIIMCEITLLKEQTVTLIKPSWNIYKLKIDQSLFKMDRIANQTTKNPIILKQTFDLAQVGDTYIDMHNYRKGYVWINGRNLGRYWNRGPQLRLYCPGVWLKKQKNQIVILQLLSQKEEAIRGQHTISDPI